MAEYRADVIIIGGGIAGLSALQALRKRGYHALLLESDALGAGQSIAAQGIIHAGLKYALAGKISPVAQRISAMPERWRAALKDWPAHVVTTESQTLMIPAGMVSGLMKALAQKALGSAATEIHAAGWPQAIKASGFAGSIVALRELVLDVPALLQAMAAPHTAWIKRIDWLQTNILRGDEGLIDGIATPAQTLTAKAYIFSAAAANLRFVRALAHDKGLETQTRPLLMAMMKPAPFALWAHLVGMGEKPLATITTHRSASGELLWYIGGGIAERAKESDPAVLYRDCRALLKKFMPNLDLSHAQWAALPIDRVEGKTGITGWMPDTPTLHAAGNALYAWPTKLTFAPLLADMITQDLERRGIIPSGMTAQGDLDLPPAPIANAPWDTALWTNENSA